jgi:transposase
MSERHNVSVLGQCVLGIDTHKLTHVAVILNGLGRHEDTLQFSATDAGATELLGWSQRHGSPLVAGIEGTGSYGYQLTRFLQSAGVTVVEVNRPDRANRRRKGKSDPIDAEAAARAVVAGQATAVPKNREGAVEALRALTITRNSAVKATTTASNQIKALLVGAGQDLRDEMRVQSLLQLATRCSQLVPVNGLHAALASLGRRWLQLHVEVVALDRMIRDLVRRTVPRLIERPGIGMHTAAQLLITAGGNPDRLHSDTAFAALCGASPVQASSGQRHRHRLSRGGDRAANNALWTIANNRMIHDARTREFAEKRRGTGDSRKDTLRVLKRYIARETFAIIRTALSTEQVLADVA